jgi:transposase
MDDSLFDRGDLPGSRLADVPASSPEATAPVGKPRLRLPQRDQIEMHCEALDHLLEPEHPARIVWAAVCQLDLSAWLSEVKAVEGHVGRDGTDPRLLLALWIYATLQGVGSARRLDDLCRKHIAYRWLCGGVSVNYHLLSDFRSQEGDKWDELLTQIVATLMAEDLVTMNCVAQDGMRVRAHAGRSSFRRRQRLEDCLEQARQQVATLKSLEDSGEELSRRERAARERAAVERQERLEEALRQCEQLQQQREERAKIDCRPAKEARASTTDPEARNMKFANGGYGPGHNVQFSTDTASGVIVGVEVTNAGSDGEQLPPMLDQLQERYTQDPQAALVDGGFVSKQAIADAAESHHCTVYAPLKDEEKQRKAGKDPHARKKGDHSAVAAWRVRMGTEEAKLLYRLRAQTAEWVNALCRNRGLQQMPVRGLPKCRIVALLYAITHNLLRGVTLRAAAAQGTS